MTCFNDPISKGGVCLTRRRFVQGLAMSGAFARMGLGSNVFATAMKKQGPETLRGTEFNLTIGEQAVNFTGALRIGTTVNGLLPAPILRWQEGDTVTLHVTNLLPETSSIHWHGIILPSAMDDPGVGLSNNGPPVLTYADLKNLRTTHDQREPDRETELHLAENMGRYMWSINGVKHADVEPIEWSIKHEYAIDEPSHSIGSDRTGRLRKSTRGDCQC